VIPPSWLSYFLALSLYSLVCLGIPGLTAAHPMGNFSINHFSALEVHPTIVRLLYVIDMAEIPTFQEMHEHGIVALADDPKTIAYRNRKGEELGQGLVLRHDDSVLPLTLRASAIAFPPGAGELPTLRLTLVYEATLAIDHGTLAYEDYNYSQRIGWKEIVAQPHSGVDFSQSSVPLESKSKQLSEYTTDLLQAPPQDLRATLRFTTPVSARVSAPLAQPLPDAAAPAVAAAPTPRSVLTELMTARPLSPGLLVLSLVIAVGLGALHALEPGHGKTLVAAYLVGSRGTARQALWLGLTVTASHTIGVFALGAVALFASHYVVPEQLYPWLELTSGVLIVGMGMTLLQRMWRHDHGSVADGHTQAHGHTSHHHYHGHTPHHHHTHGYGQHTHTHDDHDGLQHGRTLEEPHEVSYGTLLTLGVTGGMIPCPGALVVLLSAVALQRIAWGILLIVAFSLGLAAVLVATGLLLVSARGIIQRWSGGGSWLPYLPFLSPVVMIPLGLFLTVQALQRTGLLPALPF